MAAMDFLCLHDIPPTNRSPDASLTARTKAKSGKALLYLEALRQDTYKTIQL